MRQRRDQSYNSYPYSPSSSPPDNVAGGGGPTACDLWTAGPDYWSALWGPGARAPLLGKSLGRVFQGEEAEGSFRGPKDREGLKWPCTYFVLHSLPVFTSLAGAM